MMQTRITFACDNCGARQQFYWYGSPEAPDKERAATFREVLNTQQGWHYVPYNESADGRTWELCNIPVCKKCKDKKLKSCQHSCQAKYETIKKGAPGVKTFDSTDNTDPGPGGDQSDLVAMDYYTGLEKSG